MIKGLEKSRERIQVCEDTDIVDKAIQDVLEENKRIQESFDELGESVDEYHGSINRGLDRIESTLQRQISSFPE
jgi:cell division septum initiation protein DivIVA